MYCVKCGVRLQEGAKACPLCRTPTWNPDNLALSSPSFSSAYPDPQSRRRYPILGFITAVMIAIDLVFLIYCLRTYQSVSWSGYIMLGSAVIYLIVILPLWINRPHPLVFVPLTFLVLGGYLLYICLATGGTWFLSFAFPVTMLSGLIATASTACFRYIRRGKLFIVAGLFLVIGCSSMLVELFQAITFEHEMFAWSLYVVSGFGAVGLFVLLAALIRPLREYLERKIFL